MCWPGWPSQNRRFSAPTMLGAPVIILILMIIIYFTTAQEVEVGYFLGTKNGVTGEVNIKDSRTFHIIDFSYDGKASAVFFMGMKRMAKAGTPYSAQGVAFQHGLALANKTCERLYRTENSEMEVFIPDRIYKITDFNMLSVYDYQTCSSLGQISIPAQYEKGVIPPAENKNMPVNECITYLPPCSRLQTLRGKIKARSQDGTPDGKKVKKIKHTDTKSRSMSQRGRSVGSPVGGYYQKVGNSGGNKSEQSPPAPPLKGRKVTTPAPPQSFGLMKRKLNAKMRGFGPDEAA